MSPKKTWEGALASLLASLVVGMLMYNYALPISGALLQAHLIQPKDGFFALQKPPLWPAFLLLAGTNIAAQLGDLVESLIKRGADVKDSGAILRDTAVCWTGSTRCSLPRRFSGTTRRGG